MKRRIDSRIKFLPKYYLTSPWNPECILRFLVVCDRTSVDDFKVNLKGKYHEVFDLLLKMVK